MSLSGKSYALKDRIFKDPDFTPLNDDITILQKQRYHGKVGKIYVNGELIGYTPNSLDFAQKWRIKRRKNEGISRYTTIYWNILLNEVHFYVDAGRALRPLLVVYSEGSGKSICELYC